MAEIPANPIRIVQLNSIFNGLGTDNLALELARGLQECDQEVWIAASEGNGLIPKARRLGLTVETFPPKTVLSLGMIRHVATLIRRTRTQIIHAHQGRDYWPAVIAARLAGLGTKVVISRHLMTRPRFFTRWFLLRASDVVAVSQVMFRALSRELSGPKPRLHQIYGGIDLDVFSPPTPGEVTDFRAKRQWPLDAVVFGIVGSFNLPRGKGHLELLQAAAQIRTRIPGLRIAMIGSGTMKALLLEEIARLGLQGTVDMLGFSHDIAEAVKALDIVVHPATGSEGLGLVLIEALGCAKPVIASNLDGIPEAFVNGKHGLLVPPGDVSALAKAMAELGSAPELRQQMGRAGRAFVETKFSRQIYARNTLQLYAEILER